MVEIQVTLESEIEVSMGPDSADQNIYVLLTRRRFKTLTKFRAIAPDSNPKMTETQVVA